MSARIQPIVERWWDGTNDPAIPPHNGFYDNSIIGVRTLNDFANQPASNTYYFTMSFDATVEFPDESLTSEDLATLPLSFPLILANPFNVVGHVAAATLSVASHLPGVPNIVDMARWAVQVANSHLGSLGYFNRSRWSSGYSSSLLARPKCCVSSSAKPCGRKNALLTLPF